MIKSPYSQVAVQTDSSIISSMFCGTVKAARIDRCRLPALWIISSISCCRVAFPDSRASWRWFSISCNCRLNLPNFSQTTRQPRRTASWQRKKHAVMKPKSAGGVMDGRWSARQRKNTALNIVFPVRMLKCQSDMEKTHLPLSFGSKAVSSGILRRYLPDAANSGWILRSFEFSTGFMNGRQSFSNTADKFIMKPSDDRRIWNCILGCHIWMIPRQYKVKRVIRTGKVGQNQFNSNNSACLLINQSTNPPNLSIHQINQSINRINQWNQSIKEINQSITQSINQTNQSIDWLDFRINLLSRFEKSLGVSSFLQILLAVFYSICVLPMRLTTVSTQRPSQLRDSAL